MKHIFIILALFFSLQHTFATEIPHRNNENKSVQCDVSGIRRVEFSPSSEGTMNFHGGPLMAVGLSFLGAGFATNLIHLVTMSSQQRIPFREKGGKLMIAGTVVPIIGPILSLIGGEIFNFYYHDRDFYMYYTGSPVWLNYDILCIATAISEILGTVLLIAGMVKKIRHRIAGLSLFPEINPVFTTTNTTALYLGCRLQF